MKYEQKILEEIQNALVEVEEREVVKLIGSLLNSTRVFVTGQGRSGFMIKSFAMRLMHMGFEVYVLGETITPSISQGDLLVIASGSGETGSLVETSIKAKKIGANVALITADKSSSIAQNSDVVVEIKAQTKGSESKNTIQPMGSLFEQSLLILCDSMILRLMDETKKDNSNMFSRHANLE